MIPKSLPITHLNVGECFNYDYRIYYSKLKTKAIIGNKEDITLIVQRNPITQIVFFNAFSEHIFRYAL